MHVSIGSRLGGVSGTFVKEVRVSTMPSTGDDSMKTGAGARKSIRPKRHNAKVSGPEWIGPK